MKKKSIEKYINSIAASRETIEASAIESFIRLKGIDQCKSKRIKDSMAKADTNVAAKIAEYFNSNEKESTIYDLVEVFECLVSNGDKKEKGIVYTPYETQKIIIDGLFNGDEVPKICDPSCGCGSLLLTSATEIHNRYGLSFNETFCEYIVGIELESTSIRQAAILFDLLCMENGESVPLEYNLFTGDATDKKLLDIIKKKFGGFDCVIGNPPYVRSKNIGEAGKKNLHYWKSASIGNVDLYIPFYEIGLYLLKEVGILGYISPNTYMQAVNGRALRGYIVEEKNSVRIIDFRDSQVFDGVTSYTCITWIEKGSNDNKLYYSRIKDSDDINTLRYAEYDKKTFLPDKRWRMYDENIDSLIFRLENAGKSLDSWKIRNGLATLKNDIYFFTPVEEDKEFYWREYDGKRYKIEKDLCIDVAKPNIIRNEKELVDKAEKAIFPYCYENGGFMCYAEKDMKKRYPSGYRFLSDYKEILACRDKGKGDYPEWYAYGRTQGMNNFGKKLLIPYISGEPIAVLCSNPNMLFYCGYAVISEDEDELKILKCFLESEAFWFYICSTSKPYSKGYMAFAKNYIAKFSIPSLSDDEKQWLLAERSVKKKNEWIWKKYGIEPDVEVKKAV